MLETKIVTALGSVQKQNRVQKLIHTHQVETIYHAAAYKHVPLVEENVIEGIRNNVFGTLACAEAAIAEGVKKFHADLHRQSGTPNQYHGHQQTDGGINFTSIG
ncbi:polysaccharide biosynthesis protein [Dickeya ananatis]